FISQGGMVQRTSVRGISRYGRASQGVRLMNIRDDDQVSAVALVVESEAETAAKVAEDGPVSVADDDVVADAAAQEAAAADDPTSADGPALPDDGAAGDADDAGAEDAPASDDE